MNVTLERHNENLTEVNGLLTDEKQCAVTIAPDRADIQMILDEQKKKTAEAFKVLIIGAFNAGKTSMINALAGREDFLPTGSLPETGVITELVYGEQYRITLYPKEGSGITDPVVLVEPTENVFKKYCSIDNQASMNGELTSNMKYERVVAECNIPLLKEGIMLIDTVGMNDPWGNDFITERYFPKADAVIYLMDATHIYTADDKRLLTHINDFGFRDLIIVYTHFSDVLYQNRRKPEIVIKDFCDVARRHAANHTDIGDMGIHFIDSLEGLDGKLSGDHDKVVRSGIDGLEKFYTRYLVENKGRMKIQVLNNTMQKLAGEMTSLSDNLKANAKDELLRNNNDIEKADQELVIAEEKMRASVAHFKETVQKSRSLIEASITNHVGQLANKVNLDDYVLKEELPRGVRKLIPGQENKKAKAIQEECQTELTRRMEAANKAWTVKELSKQLSEVIKDSIEGIGQELSDFYVKMDSVDATLSGNRNKEKTKRAVTDVVTGVAYTLLMGDPFTGAMAITHGKGALGKAVAGQIAVGFALGLLGVPITLPVLVAASLITNLVAILLGNSERKEQRLKTEFVEQFRKAYSESISSQQATVSGMLSACDKVLEKAGVDLENMLQNELDHKRSEVLAVHAFKGKSVEEQKAIIRKNDEALKTLEIVCEKGKAIAAQYN